MEEILLAFSTPIMIALIIAEMIYSHFHHKNLYKTSDTFINLICTSWNFINDLIFRGASLFLLISAGKYAVFEFSEKGWIYWIMLFFAQDFAYYVLHYADHNSRFFWASHVTHHSSQQFNFTVAIRSSVFQPFYRFIFYIPLALFGFQALDILFMYALCQVYGFWVHTEVIGKLHPIIEYIFVTPSHHRVHHASNPLYLDQNMGMVLIIWDRVFGTFTEERKDIPPVFGITKNVQTINPLKIVFNEWGQMIKDIWNAPDLKSAVYLLFGPPGWSADGKGKTSSQLKKDYLIQQRVNNNLDT